MHVHAALKEKACDFVREAAAFIAKLDRQRMDDDAFVVADQGAASSSILCRFRRLAQPLPTVSESGNDRASRMSEEGSSRVGEFGVGGGTGFDSSGDRHPGNEVQVNVGTFRHRWREDEDQTHDAAERVLWDGVFGPEPHRPLGVLLQRLLGGTFDTTTTLRGSRPWIVAERRQQKEEMCRKREHEISTTQVAETMEDKAKRMYVLSRKNKTAWRAVHAHQML